MKNWKPNSWRAKTAKHLPVYENEGKLNEVLKEISKLHLIYLRFHKQVNVLQFLLSKNLVSNFSYSTYSIYRESSKRTRINYSTVTDLAKFLGLSMS